MDLDDDELKATRILNGCYKEEEDFISKSKIREKIEELKIKFKEYKKSWNGNKQSPIYISLIRIGAEIDILKDLLKEE